MPSFQPCYPGVDTTITYNGRLSMRSNPIRMHSLRSARLVAACLSMSSKIALPPIATDRFAFQDDVAAFPEVGTSADHGICRGLGWDVATLADDFSAESLPLYRNFRRRAGILVVGESAGRRESGALCSIYPLCRPFKCRRPRRASTSSVTAMTVGASEHPVTEPALHTSTQTAGSP